MKRFFDNWRLITMGGVVLGSFIVSSYLYKDFRGFREYEVPGSVELAVQKGWGIQKTAHELAQLGIVSSPTWFVLLGVVRDSILFQAGYYRFEKGMRVDAILDRLRRGDVAKGKLVIAEGLTLREVADHLKKKDLLEAAMAVADPGLPARLGLEAHSLEGFLFPNTYYYRIKDPKDDIILRMVTQGKKVLDQEWMTRPPGYTLSIYETLIIASMIEKETGNAAERPHVSGVFHNRLRRKMKLQSDPTVVYGIPNFMGSLTRAQLLAPTPYNTYTIPGLPPTPICNPGRASIHAALHPEESEDLYFVSRGDGTHIFSRNLSEHNKNVVRFQHPGGR
ncbi:MAG: endolytic transglycosylase MltG [Magnetococcales bacterium]|nr:endolytic transglycosylase MltG [Magnetococcales bacterium]